MAPKRDFIVTENYHVRLRSTAAVDSRSVEATLFTQPPRTLAASATGAVPGGTVCPGTLITPPARHQTGPTGEASPT